MSEVWAVVRRAVDIIENGDIPEAKSVVESLKAEGITANMHVGTPPEAFTSTTTAEWVLGGIVDIVENEAWFCVNSWINVARYQAQRFAAPVAP